MGGEKLKHPKYTTDEGGSPPHGRGKVLQVAPLCAEPGITPAWAGKSGYWERRSGACRDHPRVGGEKTAKIILWHSCQGSPPRGRGKGRRVVNHHPLPGITPA